MKKKELSLFAWAVYAEVKKISKGKVATYAWVARKIGHPGAVRAVGRALNKNPFAPKVPCHRVIKSDFEIGGFALGVQEKELLLKKEGVEIKNGRIKEEFVLVAKKQV